jgi:hypothetical protein
LTKYNGYCTIIVQVYYTPKGGKTMGEQYKCKVCSKNIGKTEGHFRSGNSRGWVHADCKGKAKPAKAPKAPKAAKPAKPAKNGKNGKSKTVQPKAPKAGVPAIDLEPDTTADAEEDADEAAADAAALAAAIAGETTEDGPKVAE